MGGGRRFGQRAAGRSRTVPEARSCVRCPCVCCRSPVTCEASFRLIRNQAAADMELWNSEDVARFLKRDAEYFNRRIKPLPGFPRPRTMPVLIGGRVARSRPVWLADEVKEWTQSNLVVVE